MVAAACGELSEENRGDFPRRDGVPRGVAEDGLPCIFMQKDGDYGRSWPHLRGFLGVAV